VWEKKDGGYEYVNKENDVLYFSGMALSYWVLLKSIDNNFALYHKDDETARQQFMVQLKGCKNIAFDILTCRIDTNPMERVLVWLETFGDMKRLILVFGSAHGVNDRRLANSDEFVIPDETTLNGRGRMEISRFKDIIRKLKEVESQKGVRIPKVEAVYVARKGDARESWATGFPICAS
jgi:hypothetical protein